jgi:hypothetical protein
LCLGARLVGEHEEVVEDLLREFVVVEQRAGRVGHDELIGFLAVADREGVVFIVLHQADDLELQLLPVGRFDNENVAKFEQAVVARSFVASGVVRMGVLGRMEVVIRLCVAVR